MRTATATALLLVLALSLLGCGSSGLGSSSMNGSWTAILTNSDGSTAYQFSATFSQGSGGVLSISDLVFAVPGPCMSSAQPGSGSFMPGSGAFAMSMASLDVGGPMMNLQGTLGSGEVSGTWSASEVLQPCSGNGSFTMRPSLAG